MISLRLDHELHRRAAERAGVERVSLNDWGRRTIQNALGG
ncbi:MAG: toxin-antitoxin system HicB family antitoxin [Anaerolineales bacterium]|nr:toxin-antitoxin system HicB family antitoxin [Anaerolineales bacterium]